MFRLILGPSGSGKTTAICKEIIDRSLREPDRQFFILVPDQFTMQTQTDVVKMHPGKGIMNIDVLSFSRLIHRVFDETGAPRELILDDLGKNLLLRRAAQNIRNELPVIGSGMNRAGYADEVKSVISEFMQYNISPDTLDTLIENAGDRKALQARLVDLQKLYRTFLETIAEKYITSEETVSICAKRIPDSLLFKDAIIAVDGFTGFTPVQYLLLRALYAHAGEMIFSFTLREALPAGGNNELFALTLKTVSDLTRHMWEEEMLIHPSDTPPLDVWSEYRREHAGDVMLGRDSGAFLVKSPALIHLEENLFAHPSLPYKDNSLRLCESEASDVSLERISEVLADVNVKNDLDISLMCCSTVREEVRQTFRMIHAKLREDTALMYRDFAILCADQETYADAIGRMAGIFDIPIFEDKTRSVRRNPVFEYLRSVLEIVRTSFDTDAVLQYLRSGLAPYSREETAVLDTYVTALRIRGKRAWSEEFKRPYRDNIKRSEENGAALLETAEGIRKRLYHSFLGLLQAFEKKEGAGSVTKQLYLLMEGDGVAEKLHHFENAFLQEGNESKASEYAQIYAKIMTLLESLYSLLHDEDLSAREYAEVLEAGFAELKVGTIPQNVDRVQVGDLERTRLRDVKYLYFLGAHDGVIPRAAGGGGVLSEIDRQYLRSACPDVELAPSPVELMNTQSLYLYMMMTKPVSGLTVSFPKLDPSGKSLRPAYIINRLQSMFPQVRIISPERDNVLMQTETRQDLYKQLTPLFRRFAAGFLKEKEESVFLDTCSVLSEDMQGADAVLSQRAAAAFRRYDEEKLDIELAGALYGAVRMNSVSRLELFASCAYAHFIKYGLRLAEKATGEFGAATLGSVYHAVLEAFAQALNKEGLSWNSFSATQAESLLDQALHELIRDEYVMPAETKKDLFELKRIRRILYRTVMTLQYQLKKGDFTPLYAEQDFRRKDMRGRIDRVDIAVGGSRDLIKIVDYKSGHKDFDVTLMYYGLQMQLLTYMDAALEKGRAEHGGREQIPAALLYYRVADPIIGGDKEGLTPTSSAAEIDALKRTALRTTGLVNADEEVLKKLDRDMGQKSDVIPVSVGKSGFSSTSNMFETEEYELLSAHVSRLEDSFASRIARGEMQIAPAHAGDTDACRYCAYRSVCGFDTGVPGYGKRELENLTMQDVIDRTARAVLSKEPAKAVSVIETTAQ